MLADRFIYRYTTHIFFIGLLIYAMVAVKMTERVMTVMVLTSLLTFMSYLGVMLYSARREEQFYTSKKLCSTVLLYTVLTSMVFMGISYYYTEDTFLFSKGDAMFYFSNAQRFADSTLEEGLRYITSNYEFDDWGGLFFSGFLINIWPEKEIVNVAYLFLGMIGSLYLFWTGRLFMPSRYAYQASLAFSISSFWIFFHSGFLKETTMVFIIIAAFYHIYSFLETKHVLQAVFAAFFVMGILFYRPAIAGFIIISVMTYYGILMRKRAIGFFLIFFAIGLFVVSFSYMMHMADKYTAGGDIDGVVSYRSNSSYSGSFNYFVSFFGAFLGPFPTLTSPDPEQPRHLQFLAPGVIYRLFLAIPFWLGVWLFLKEKALKVLPLVLFIIVEMLATGALCASLELRKVLPHIPLMYIISFYALYHYSKEKQQTFLWQKASYIIAFGILVLWNLIKVKA